MHQLSDFLTLAICVNGVSCISGPNEDLSTSAHFVSLSHLDGVTMTESREDILSISVRQCILI